MFGYAKCSRTVSRWTQKLVGVHSCASVHGGFVCAEPPLIGVVRHTSSGATDFHTQLSFVGSSHWGGLELDSVFGCVRVDRVFIVKYPDLQF